MYLDKRIDVADGRDVVRNEGLEFVVQLYGLRRVPGAVSNLHVHVMLAAAAYGNINFEKKSSFSSFTSILNSKTTA